MADLVQTAANVQLMEQTVSTKIVQAGAAITQGQPVFLDTTDSKYDPAQANTQARALAAGIALTPAAANEYFVLATSGKLDVGATLTKGTTYVVSDNAAGAIAPESDLATSNWITHLGIATATDTLKLNIVVSATTKP